MKQASVDEKHVVQRQYEPQTMGRWVEAPGRRSAKSCRPKAKRHDAADGATTVARRSTAGHVRHARPSDTACTRAQTTHAAAVHSGRQDTKSAFVDGRCDVGTTPLRTEISPPTAPGAHMGSCREARGLGAAFGNSAVSLRLTRCFRNINRGARGCPPHPWPQIWYGHDQRKVAFRLTPIWWRWE